MNPFDVGDPYIEWGEENASREPNDLLTEYFIKEKNKMTQDELKESVIKILVAEYDFTNDDAEETITESISDHPDFWNENAMPESLAKALAENDDDE